METNKYQDFCVFLDDKDKAIDIALFANFKARLVQPHEYSVIEGPDDNYAVVNRKQIDSLTQPEYIKLPAHYLKLTFNQLQKIKQDVEPVPHWETIVGIFSSQDGEILRFILDKKIPLDKFIRLELAARGHDKDHTWVGFDKAYEQWIGEEE